jgi:hypothetical protein
MTLSGTDLESNLLEEAESKSGQATSTFSSSSELCDRQISVHCESEANSFMVKRGSQDNQARMKFLQKLSYERVWIPKAQRPPSHQTLIIFDWDDTLLCTGYLNKFGRCGLELLPVEIQETLEDAGRVAAKLLGLALSLGQTFIITNAVHGWVEQSASFWAP